MLEQKKYLSAQLTSLGPQKAYMQLKAENENTPVNFQHGIAHVFGQLLYERVGIDGIAICDASFSFGCYHAFFTTAIADKGDNIIKDLNAVCITKFGPLGTGCPHGIGHGILEYMGPHKLDQALKVCDSIQKFSLLGCSSGVFMEYNFPTLIDGDEVSITKREFDPDNPFAPCDSIELKFRPSCYFEISQWWKSSLGSDSLQKIGMLCDTLKDTRQREACFIGLGSTIAPEAAYGLETSVSECEHMPIGTPKILCLSGVSWSFFAMPGEGSKSDAVCQSLALEERKFCKEKADLTALTFH